MPLPLHVATTPLLLHRGSCLMPAELIVVFVLYAPAVSGGESRRQRREEGDTG